MKYLQIIVLPAIVLFLSACSDDSISFGTVEYYPKFLWVDANITPVTKTIDFDFSSDAKADSEVFAEFQFVDNNGDPIESDIMQVEVDGKILKDNIFRVNNSVQCKDLKFSFTPNKAKKGKHQGFLKLINHKLDRLDSQVLTPGQKIYAFQWTLYFDEVMNPLGRLVMWIIAIITLCHLIWFIFIRPMRYPHFKRFTKSVLIEQNGKIVAQMNFVFKGARKVVFSDCRIKESRLKRFYVGKTRTLINSCFKTPLTFVPRKKNAMVYGSGYVIKPNPIPKNGVAEIINTQQKLKIIIR